MYLKENTVFDLDLGINVKNNAQHPRHYVIYVLVKLEDAMLNGLGDAFTRKYSYDICRDVTQHPLQHVTCTPITFEVAMSKG